MPQGGQTRHGDHSDVFYQIPTHTKRYSMVFLHGYGQSKHIWETTADLPIDSMAKHDVIFIGFPIWDMKMPPPMKSFLKQYNLSGKTIIPFNTNTGYGIGSGFKTIKQVCPTKSKILDGCWYRTGRYSIRDGRLQRKAGTNK